MRVEIKIPEHTIINAGDTNITIQHKGLRSLANNGKLGTVKIPYWAIASVDFRKSTFFGGKFVLNPIGGSQQSGPFADTTYGNSNGVVFRNDKNKEMAALKDYVENKIQAAHEAKNNQSAPQEDAADQIKKYKELADEGTITKAEFEAKKKKLLDL